MSAANLNITAYSDALVVLGTAGFLIPIFRRWGVNPVLGYLAAGAILGPLGLGSFVAQFHPLYWFTIADAASVAGIAELGIVFLLFVIGLELSLQRLASMRRLVAGLGGLQVLFSATLITAGAMMMGQSLPTAIILGASLSLSSTAIVLELLARQNRLSTSPGIASFAVLLAQDIAAIPILMFVAMGGSNAGGSAFEGLLQALLQASIAITVIVAFGHFLMRPFFRLVATARSSELFIAAVLFVIVGAGVVAHQAGMSMALGAFISGLLLAETEYRKAIQASIDPFKGLLLGVFFFTVGMRIDIREIFREPVLLFSCVLALIAVKAVVLTGLARLFRFSWPASLETGLLLGPGGEFAFVIIGMAADMHLLTPRVSGIALAITAVTMASTPLLSSAARHLTPAPAKGKPATPELWPHPAIHAKNAIVVGYGRVGRVVCDILHYSGVPFIATDYDPMVVVGHRRNGHELYFGDASDPEFLKACGLPDATGVIITINAREAIDDIVAHVRSTRPAIPIIARARDADHARHLYSIGASDAVPETIEASLQLSEAALAGLGVPPESAVAAVHEKREELRHVLQHPKHKSGEHHK